MSVYVDSLIAYPTKIHCFKTGSCHLEADTLDELHAFAARLGLRREWFQDHQFAPHYDLTPSKRAKAIALGAIEQSRVESVKRRRERRASTCEAPKDKSPIGLKDIANLFANRGERCGKPKTRDTVFGPMCEECWAHLRETTRRGENVLGIANGYPKKAKDES